MSTQDKNERNDEHWNEIVNIVKRNNTSENKSTDLKGTDMSHDDAIFDFISSEIERTSTSAATSDAPAQAASLTLPAKLSKFVNETLFPKTFAGGARGVAAAALFAAVIIPFAYQATTNTDGNTLAFDIPSSVTQVASDTRKHLDYSSGSLSLASGQQTDVYKAFMTGVVLSDIKLIDSYDNADAVQLKRSLYEYHAIDIIQTTTTQADSEKTYNESLTAYKSSDEHSKWLYKGMTIELIYLTANVGLETKTYEPLIDMLARYRAFTQNKTFDGQSEKYYAEHELLLSYADKATNNALTDSDLKNIRKHARNLKVRVK